MVNCKVAAALTILALLLCSSAEARLRHFPGGAVPPPVVSDEEFVGPFASWLNVKTIHSVNPSCANATGNGTTDDAAAIQCAINSLSASNSVLYFPAGTYKIGSTISIGGWVSGSTEELYYCMIGADPATTQIVWGGGSTSMFVINGLSQGCVGRLTFDGQSVATTIIDDVSAGTGGAPCISCAFDTGNTYFDVVAKNGGTFPSYGFRCGYQGNGCSETTIVRDQFSNVSAGVQMCNSNALDIWIWYSTFSSDILGVSDYHVDSGPYTGLGAGCGGGEWHVGNSVFLSSALGDLFQGNPNPHTVTDSYSNGSNQFTYVGSRTVIVRNTVLNTTQGVSLNLQDIDLLIDNQIKTKVGNTAPVVSSGSAFGYFGVGNVYTVSSAVDMSKIIAGSYYSIQDTVGTITDSAAPTYPTPSNNGRTVYEAGTLGLQTAVCKASNGASSTFSAGACTGTPDGLKNVAHLAAGSYTASASIIVPANSNVQIIGDGYTSLVDGSGGTANPVFLVNGPTHVVMRNFQFVATPTTDGIKISGADQVGGTVYLWSDDFAASGSGSVPGTAPLMTALYSDNLSNTLIEAYNFSIPYASGSTLIQTGANQINVFFGSGTLNYQTFVASASANLFVESFWYDGPAATTASPNNTITGNGSFYYTGGSFAPVSSSPVDFATLNNFTGNAAVLLPEFSGPCPSTAGKLNITGSSSSGGQELAAFGNYLGDAAINNSATGNTVRFLLNKGLNQSTCSGITYTDTGTMDSTVTNILTRYRTIKPMIPLATAPGVTGAELYNLIGTTAANILHIAP